MQNGYFFNKGGAFEPKGKHYPIGTRVRINPPELVFNPAELLATGVVNDVWYHGSENHHNITFDDDAVQQALEKHLIRTVSDTGYYYDELEEL